MRAAAVIKLQPSVTCEKKAYELYRRIYICNSTHLCVYILVRTRHIINSQCLLLPLVSSSSSSLSNVVCERKGGRPGRQEWREGGREGGKEGGKEADW